MELRFSCPQCGSGNRVQGAEERTVLECARCDYVGLLPLEWARGRRVEMCPLCGGMEFYRRRDVDQRLVILTLIAGLLLAPVTRYFTLAVAAAGAALLWLAAPERLTCYRCLARIRGHEPSERHRRYDAKVSARHHRERGARNRRRRDSVGQGDRASGE